MAAGNKGLGRGLDALFSRGTEARSDESGQAYELISVDCLRPHPNQPRKDFSSQSLRELAQSISEQGLLQPLLVRPAPQDSRSYQIIAGERRWRACKIAQMERVPAIVYNLSDSEAMVLALAENLQRQDLNAVEEAEGLLGLQELTGASQEELSKRVGKSRSSIANSLRLLKLESEILEAIREGRIGPSQARNLLAIEDSRTRLEVFQLLLEDRLTIRELESVVAYWREHGSLPTKLASNKAVSSYRNKEEEFGKIKKRIQQIIGERFQIPVTVRGSPDKGTISFSYASRQELEQLLRGLGLEENDVSRETQGGSSS